MNSIGRAQTLEHLRPGSLRADLRAGNPKLGIFLQMSDPLAAEIVGRAGFDFAVVDLEHGSLTTADVTGLVRAADLRGLAVIARVPIDRLAIVSQMLDSGCRGVLAPRVRNAEEAARVVAAARYAPVGSRGVCPGTRANDVGWLPWEDHVRLADATTVVAVALEDPDAIAAAPDICAVPGIDVVFIGTFDLAAELGLAGQVRHPIVLRAVETVVAAAAPHEICVGAIAGSVHGAAEWYEMGLRFLPVSTDVLLWRETCLSVTEAWRIAFPADGH